ncbi:pleckstrin homology domain-containing family D member 1-like [Dysidea avara]|uniref:pleckstrin homology domain-containing family D member 1-like n=1 Tax=Dysidea avara TaxID=196820 RepID=UPI00331DC922
MAESGDTIDIDAKVQMFGLLFKKPFGHKSQRWQKRFFIVKEGFLMYYSDNEGKAFDRSHHFNIHPKGVIPLGGCMVDECEDGAQKFAIKISHPLFKGQVFLGAENAEESKRWAEALRESGKVTWKNAQLGEKVILQLEQNSKQIAQEKQDYIDKLNEAASKLESELGKKQELETMAAALAEEKKNIEVAAKNLREEKDTTESELHQTLSAMKQIEEQRTQLQGTFESLQSNLKFVEEEKQKAAEELQEREHQTLQLQQENKRLSETTVILQTGLEALSEEKAMTAAALAERERIAKQLEEEKKRLEMATTELKTGLEGLAQKSEQLEKEKETVTSMLEEKEKVSILLEDEKKRATEQAKLLEMDLENVLREKEKTLHQVEEERAKRKKTEKRLRHAEDSLKRLDKALRDSGIKIDIEIEADVTNLKNFFEDCVAEASYEAQKIDIMRDAVRARVSYERARENSVTDHNGTNN